MSNYQKLLAKLRAEGKPIGRVAVASSWSNVAEPVAKATKPSVKANKGVAPKPSVSSYGTIRPRESDLRAKLEEEKRQKMIDSVAAKCRLDYVKTAEGPKAG